MIGIESSAESRVYALNYWYTHIGRSRGRRNGDVMEAKVGENLKEKQAVTMTNATERSNKWRVNEILLYLAIRKV